MIKEGEVVHTDKYEIPVWRKYTLSVQEAAKYFRIGDKKLKKVKLNKKVKVGKKAFLFTKVKGQKTT